MALINQNSIIGVTSITSPSSSNVLTVHANDTTERLRISETGLSFSGTNSSLDTSGNATFNGNVSIGGTLTYEDVTNIDSVGIITAQSGIHVTAGNVGIGTDNPAGTLEISAASTTDMIMLDAAGTNFARLGHNTASGTDILDVRSEGHTRFLTGGNNERLRIDSSGNLTIPGNSSVRDITYGDGSTAGYFRSATNVNRSNAEASIHMQQFKWNNTKVAEIKVLTGDDTTNKDNAHIVFETATSGTTAERLRITSAGVIQCGTSATLKAEINNAVSGHQFISQCSDNNNGFEVYQQHGSNTTRNNLAVYANTGSSNAKHLQFSVRGDGNVGINTTAPQSRLEVFTDNDTDFGDSSNTNNTNSLIRLFNKNGTDNTAVNNYVGIRFDVANGATSSAWLSYVRTGNNTGAFQFKARNAASSYPEVARILSSGGITFGGDTAQANALNDYEEGTLDWRLQRTGSIGSGSNHGDTSVTYTKVGNRVYVSGYIYTANTSNSTGVTVELRDNSNTSNVATLPYVPNQAGGFPITGTRTIDDSYRNMAVTFRQGQAQVYIYKDDGDNDYLKNKNNVNIGSSQTHLVIQFCGSYTTDS